MRGGAQSRAWLLGAWQIVQPSVGQGGHTTFYQGEAACVAAKPSGAAPVTWHTLRSGTGGCQVCRWLPGLAPNLTSKVCEAVWLWPTPAARAIGHI